MKIALAGNFQQVDVYSHWQVTFSLNFWKVYRQHS